MKSLTKLDEMVLLTILKLKDNAYIVTIKSSLKKNLGRSTSFGALYLALNRLTRDGYLVAWVGDPESVKGGRAKKYYRVTKEGIMVLKEEKSLQRKMWDGFDDLADDILEIR